MEKKQIAVFTNSTGLGGVSKVLIDALKVLDYDKVDVDLFLYTKGALQGMLPPQVNVFVIDKKARKRERLLYELKRLHLVTATKVLLLWLGFHSKRADQETLQKKYAALLPALPFKPEYDLAVSFQGSIPENNMYVTNIVKAKRTAIWIHGNIGADFPPYMFSLFNDIICVSKANEEWFLKTYPNCIGKTRVLYNLLDVDDILQKSQADVDDMPATGTSIVSVGRLSSEKGFQMVPEIARKLTDAGYTFDWYLVGDGPMKQQIEDDCTKLGVANVHLLGPKPNPYPYMKRCALYVQPSFTEGFCTTTNEAKVLCKPVVTTDVPGMREQFTHGQNGYIVPHATVDDLVAGISYVLDYPELQRQFENELSNHQDDRQNDILLLKNYWES